ncbi:MAG: AsmA-like C-terminal region-containing protein [Gemmatimonadota bacterium]|jgi:hypothetical protein
MSEPPPQNPNRQSDPRLRRWLRRAVLGVFALAFLYLAVAFSLSRFLDPEELANRLEPRLTEALSRSVEVGQAKVGLFPFGVRLSEIAVSDPTGLAPEMVRVRSVDLRVKLLPLLRREVHVSRLKVEELFADLRVSEEGVSNFGDFSTRPPEGVEPEAGGPGDEDPASEEVGIPDAEVEGSGAVAPGTPSGGSQSFALDLRGISLENGEIRFTDASSSTDAAMAGLELEAAVRREASGGWLFVGSTSGELTLRRGEPVPLLQGTPVEMAFDVEADGEMENVTIRAGELRLGRMALGLSGEARDIQDPVRRVAFSLTGQELALEDLLTILPDSIQDRLPLGAEGSLAADLRVDGEVGPGRVPSISGGVAVTQGRLSLRGDPLAENLAVNLDLAPDRVVLVRSEGTVLDGPFSLDGSLLLAPEGNLDLAVDATSDLEKLETLVQLPAGVTAAGEAVAAVRISGRLGHLQDLRFNGTVRGRDVRATHPNLGAPVEIPAGEFILEGTRATANNLPVSLGEDRMVLSGEVADVFAFLDPQATPRFNGAVRGSRIDLTRLSTRPLPDSTITYGKVAFAKVGDRRLAGQTFSELAQMLGLSRPESLPMAGNLAVAFDTVIDRTGRMQGVQARLEFGPGFVRIPQATFQRYGGTISTTADLTLTPDAAAPFSFTLQVQDLDAGSFLAQTTPLGRFIKGRISMELDLVGTLDGFLLPDRPALVGSGRFSLTDGGLATAPLTQGVAEFLGLPSLREPTIRDWQSSFLLEEGKVLLADATLRGAPGSPQVGGGIGLNGELDLESIFNLPGDRLEASALERLGVAGGIAANVARRPDVVQAILRIGGSVLDPAIQADPGATARALGQAVQEEVSAEIEARIDEERAEAERVLQEQQAEARRRIEEQKEQLRDRAAGFLRGLGRRPDTAASDSIRPDTAPPDTIRPDTTRPDTVRPDTTRPDTLKPDTLRPDTLRPNALQPDTTRPDTLPRNFQTSSHQN